MPTFSSSPNRLSKEYGSRYHFGMPTDTAMQILSAYKLKQKQNPVADRATLFKYILWDRFSGKMISDSELNGVAADSASLSELAYAVLVREKPAMAEGVLAQSAKDAIRRYFRMNYPDGL